MIGVPGDHVACCNASGDVTVNGVALHEQSYLFPGNPPSTQRFSITVPPGRLWVMGDHRSVSWDSRGHMQDPGNGTIPENMVVGRAFMIVWPPSRWRVLPIPSTFGQPGIDRGRPAAACPAAAARPCPAAPYLPLGAGFVVAVPLTWLQRWLRRRRLPRGLLRHCRVAGCQRRSGAARAPAAPVTPWTGVLQRHPGYTPRRGGGLTGYERVLARAGLAPVAGIDEAGRGACAGPLVVAAVALDPRRRSDPAGVADSKALTAARPRGRLREVVARALAWHVVVIPSGDIDRLGLHVCNVDRHAPGAGRAGQQARLRADRRVPGPGPGRSRAGHVEGR